MKSEPWHIRSNLPISAALLLAAVLAVAPAVAQAPAAPARPAGSEEPEAAEPDSVTPPASDPDPAEPEAEAEPLEQGIWEPPEEIPTWDWEPQRVENNGSLDTEVGIGTLVTLPAEVERVALADASIARVQIISSREVLVTGLSPGQTTLFVWLTDGRRLRYLFQTRRNLDLLREVLADLDPAIEVVASSDDATVVLSGEVADAQTAETAVSLTERMLRTPRIGRVPQVVDLLRYPTSTTASDLWLTDALKSIDPRIRVRRIQVGERAETSRDSYILEGRVANLKALVRAVILAERQLGSTGVSVSSPDRDITGQRDAFFGDNDVDPTGRTRVGLSRPPSGLAAQVARGLIITSESGRVLSLLEVDDLPQVMVSIRVYQVDRGRAKKVGINFRFDSDKVSFGSFSGPQVNGLPDLFAQRPSITPITGGNLAGAFVNDSIAIATAIDWLEEKNLARSVAEPNVLTLSGEEASVLVGGEVPIPITNVNQVTSVQGFFFQDFGVRLSIRPTVDVDGIVALEVSPSIIRPDPGLSVGGVPGFRVQSVQTTARVPAGQSLVLGGLLSFDESLEEARVPFLGKIPLFRWRRKTREELELLFVITPRLIASPPTGPDKPVEAPLQEEIRLPELRWSEDRDQWKEQFEPRLLPEDGLPETFRAEVDEPPPAVPREPSAAAVAALEEAAEEEAREAEAEAAAAAEEEAAGPETAAAVPAAEIWVVRDEARPCLNLRPRPEVWSTPIDCLAPGTRVQVFERREGWAGVWLNDGREGWMAGFYLIPQP